ncbi:hypothetical protein CSC18_3780 [Klebsiella aerogenes]|nr:hypothetical protein CSC18_3780 [Klebsiella aerogenes]
MTYRYRFLITEYIFDGDYLFDTLSHKPSDGLPEKSSIVLAITFHRLGI